MTDKSPQNSQIVMSGQFCTLAMFSFLLATYACVALVCEVVAQSCHFTICIVDNLTTANLSPQHLTRNSLQPFLPKINSPFLLVSTLTLSNITLGFAG